MCCCVAFQIVILYLIRSSNFKMLSPSEIVKHRNKTNLNFPQVGAKQTEPSGTSCELLEIENYLTATKKLLSHERVRMIGSLTKATWNPQLEVAVVESQTGSHWSAMGHIIDGRLCLHPEEVLYLLEIGAVELTYNDVPLSIQRAYTLLLAPETKVTQQQYRVYSQLNAHGYKVLRHSTKNALTKYEKQIEIHKVGIKHKDRRNLKRKLETTSEECVTRLKEQTIVKFKNLPVNYKEGDNYYETLEKLQFFQQSCEVPDFALDIDYDVHMPSSTTGSFKKSSLQLPKCRIRVVNYEDPMPDFEDVIQLSRQFQDHVPIIHAIVFPDFVSFYQIASIDLPACSKQ